MFKYKNLAEFEAMTAEEITFRSYSKGRIGRIEVFSSHYRADTTYSKPTLITRLKNALNET